MFADCPRADVLLIDRDSLPVVVEGKQAAPSVADIRQLRHYLARLRAETGKEPRGILVHGGSRKLREDVRAEARRKPRVELVRYAIDVEFVVSG